MTYCLICFLLLLLLLFFSLLPMNLISYEKIKTFDIFSKRLWQEPIMVGPTASTFDILDLCMHLCSLENFIWLKLSLSCSRWVIKKYIQPDFIGSHWTWKLEWSHLGYAGYKFNVLPKDISQRNAYLYKKNKCLHTFLIHGIRKGSITAKSKRPRPD